MTRASIRAPLPPVGGEGGGGWREVPKEELGQLIDLVYDATK
jgi:hypothetical protein